MNIVKLNLGRNCIRYLIKLYGIKKLWVPYYCCESVWRAVRQENCRLKFYHIGNDFLPTENFQKDDFILYINYFGLCEDNCRYLAQKYKNLIVDNTQGFYSDSYGLASFNSLRKFFKVFNGAYLYAEEFLNANFEQDNLDYKPVLLHENYDDFVKNENLLDKQDLKYMNCTVENKIQTVNFENDKNQRLYLYNQYDRIFGKYNQINLKITGNNIPFCYPFSCANEEITEKLQKANLTLLRLWNDIPKHYPEYNILNNVAAFPLNDESYAQKIISTFE